MQFASFLQILYNFWSNFTVYLTLYFRHIQTYSRLIQPYLVLLRHIKNPGLFRNILLQPDSCLFQTPYIIFREIQTYFDSQLIQTCYVASIFSHIHKVRHIEVYLPTFGFILADSGIFRILPQLDIFMYIMAYSKPTAYSDIFRIVHILSQF